MLVLQKDITFKVILKNPYLFDEISILNLEIIKKVEKLDLYKSERSQIHWKYQNTNLVF